MCELEHISVLACHTPSHAPAHTAWMRTHTHGLAVSVVRAYWVHSITKCEHKLTYVTTVHTMSAIRKVELCICVCGWVSAGATGTTKNTLRR